MGLGGSVGLALLRAGDNAFFGAVTHGHPGTDFIAGAITSHTVTRSWVKQAGAVARGFDGHDDGPVNAKTKMSDP